MSNDFEKVSWPGWETVRLIGRGSFGAVYEIQRDIFGAKESAALKVITIPQNSGDIEELYNDGYDDESITSTFQSHLQSIVAEYSMMRKMNGCTNVVNCDDVRYVQHDNGIGWDIFIKMELLTPLTKALPQEIPEKSVEKLARDICNALEICKQFDIVHRDIKPQNIFVSPYGDYKLGDFGIAKTVEKTMGGTKIGTYKYMAPEVYHNQPYGTAADIYSLGLVLYWMLNERRMPFLPLPPTKMTSGMDEQARHRRLSGEQIPPPAHGSEGLKKIVLKACAFDVKDRYRSAGAMLLDLDRLASGLPILDTVDEELDGTVVGNSAILGAGYVDRYEGTGENTVTSGASQTVRTSREPGTGAAAVQNVVQNTAQNAVQTETGGSQVPQHETNEQADGEQDKDKSKKGIWIGLVAGLVAVIVLIILLLRGCGTEGPGSETLPGESLGEGSGMTSGTEPTEEQYEMELNTDRLTIFADASAVLEVSGVPEDANVRWKSSDKSVAKVNSDGEVTGVAEGTATITASWKHKGETYEVSAEVTVTASGVTLSEYTISDFYIGDSSTLTATTSPEGETVEWKSSDENVVTVSEDGTVTAVSEGTAEITVTFGKYTESCTVTVTKPSVTLSKTSSNLYAGDSTSVTVKTDPEGAAVTWSSDDSSVATVSGGTIQAVSSGTTAIRAKITHQGKTYEEVCTVKVVSPSVSVSSGSISILPGQSKSLSASSKPEGLSVSWSSSNTGVATVSGGKVTAVAPGSATITAQVSYGGKTYRSTCSVNVTTPSVSLSSGSMNLVIGQSGTLSASTNTGSSVSWSSSNTSVATVSGGKVTAVAPGSATITAQISFAGKTYKATCSVTVSEPTISVTSSASTISYSPKDKGTCTLTADVNPDGGSVSWSSSDTGVATVSGNGNTATVTAVSSGSATITATYTISGRSVTDSCTVTVEAAASTLRIDNFSYATSGTIDSFWVSGTIRSNYPLTRVTGSGSATSPALFNITLSANATPYEFSDGVYEYDAANLRNFFVGQFEQINRSYVNITGALNIDDTLIINCTGYIYDASGSSIPINFTFTLHG